MAKNGGYSAAELMAMQRDAAERVRQMQRRARERMAAAPPSPPVPAERETVPGQQSGGAAIGQLIGSFASDPDRMLLLALIFLLAREETDPKLLLALVYLML